MFPSGWSHPEIENILAWIADPALTIALNSRAAKKILLRELEAFDEFGGDGRDALLRCGSESGSWLGVRIL
jgi:hypothetical protein